MLTSVTKIDFDDLTEAIPAFIAIIAMPFLYSISEGIALGVISYVDHQSCYRKGKGEKDQRADVCAGCSVCPEIHFPLKGTKSPRLEGSVPAWGFLLSESAF